MSIKTDKNQRKQLSADELRNYTGFENYTDECAEELISDLAQLSRLFIELYLSQIYQSTENKLPENEKQAKASERSIP